MGEWVERFDDSYWEVWPDTPLGSWDNPNQEWDSEESGGNRWLYLSEIGTWVEGFRPFKIRVTFTGADSLYISLVDSDLNELCGEVVSSGETINLTDHGHNIMLFGAVIGEDDFSITNIEFFVESPHKTIIINPENRTAGINAENRKTSVKIAY